MELKNKFTERKIKEWSDYQENFKKLDKSERKMKNSVNKDGNINISIPLFIPDKIKEKYAVEFGAMKTGINQQNHKKNEKQKELIQINSKLADQNTNLIIFYILFIIIVGIFLVPKCKEKITELEKQKKLLENKISQLNSLLNQERSKLTNMIDNIKKETFEIFTNKLKRLQNEIKEIPAHLQNSWDIQTWNKWQPNTLIDNYLCVGKYTSTNNNFSVPAYIPFISQGKSIFIIHNNATKEKANSLMQSIIMRIASGLPYSSKFSFIDPVGYGSSFPIANLLNVRKNETNFSDSYRVLNDIEEDMRNTNFAYGLSENKTFETIVEDTGEKFEFVFAADFPNQYEARATEKLQNIANKGYITGKYVFVLINSDFDIPKNIDLKKFENAGYIDLVKNNNPIKQNGKTIFNFIPDNSPSEDIINQIVGKISKNKPVEKGILFADTIELAENKWWQESSISEIKAPVGKIGRDNNIEFRFNSSGEQITAHGIVAGTNGSGKSVLLNNIVMSFAMRYSPDELKFYLIDGKGGVEFQSFKNLPHAEIISLMTEPNFARSVLNDIKTEFANRMKLFNEHNINLYDDFRNKISNIKLPRILIVVDEYQIFFTRNEDPAQVSEQHAREVSNLLQFIVSKGRSFGIHLLLSSQTFSVKGLEQRESIFSNIPIRAALKMKSPDGIMEFEKEGRELIKKCDSVGKLVVNSSLGANGSNKFGRVAYLSSDEILKYAEKSQQKYSKKQKNYIFNGKEQPSLIENNQLQFLLSSNTWQTDNEIEKFAQLPEYDGGLGKDSWYSAENPIALWIGQNYNVRGKANIVLRRRKQENIIILGTDFLANYGMINSIIISTLTNKQPNKSEIYFVDKSIQGSPWNKSNNIIAKETLSINQSNKYITKNNEIIENIEKINLELEKRQKIDENKLNKLPNIYLILTEPQKIDELCYQSGKYNSQQLSEIGTKLQNIYSKGSEKGIHTIFLFESTISLKSILLNNDLVFFNHRIALQMKYQNSVLFIGNKLASMLNNEFDTKPVRALYQNIGTETSTIFKPYFVSDSFNTELISITNILKNK